MDDEEIYRDLEIINNTISNRAVKRYKKRQNAMEIYNNAEFKKNYRFDKETVRFICDLISDDIKSMSSKGSPVSPTIMVLITIRYLTKGNYQLDCADIHGVSQKTASTAIRKVVNALAAKLPEFVKFPSSSNGIQEIKRGFMQKFGFPQCLGALDCTHIKIKNPGGEIGARYRCRKGFYSINVQMLVDSNSRILDIVARWRGSAHDSRIFNFSSIKRKLQQINRLGGVILGDGGYKQSHIVMTPFRLGASLSAAEQAYQRHHMRSRNVVERTFGQFKNCFRSCFNGLQCNLTTAKNSIAAMAVLWNIAQSRRCSLVEYVPNIHIEESTYAEENAFQRGIEFRRNFVATYFSNNS